MTRSHDAIVEAQFGSQAATYVSSTVHSTGEDLDALAQICAQVRPERVLDIGTGGGHVAYRLAQHAQFVAAVALSPAMLDVVAERARERGLSNIETTSAPAERLPFEYAAHTSLETTAPVTARSILTNSLTGATASRRRINRGKRPSLGSSD